jgi:acetyl-CoA carboxylase alpha subunit
LEAAAVAVVEVEVVAAVVAAGGGGGALNFSATAMALEYRATASGYLQMISC